MLENVNINIQNNDHEKEKSLVHKISKNININNFNKKCDNLFNENKFNELFKLLKKNKTKFSKKEKLTFYYGFSAYKLGFTVIAKEIFEDLLELNPNHFDGLNCYGFILDDNFEYQKAVEVFEKALLIKSTFSPLHNNLGLSYGKLENYKKAMFHFKEAIRIDNNSDAIKNLSMTLLDQAILLHSKKKYIECLEKLKKAESFNKENVDIYLMLAICNSDMNNNEEAQKYFNFCLEQNMSSLEFYYNIARFYGYNLFNTKAIDFSYKALELNPGHLDTLNNLAIFQISLKRDFRGALKTVKQNLEYNVDAYSPYNTLGNIFFNQGMHNQAVNAYTKALMLNPESNAIYSNLLYSLTLNPNLTNDQIFQEHLNFGKKYNNIENKFNSHLVKKTINKKIKLGFVSADLKNHAIFPVLAPVIRNLDRNKFEVVLYSNSKTFDDYSKKYKKWSNKWVMVEHLENHDLAHKIRKDKIDILFDMSGHTNGNRLKTFALKPSPIQISWMGYPYTTGLQAIDYVIYDEFYVDKDAEKFFSEKVLKVKNHFNFDPLPENLILKPNINKIKNEKIFASLNHSRKLNKEVLSVWSKILLQNKNTKIFIGNLEELSLDWVSKELLNSGIDKDRLILSKTLKFENYINLHNDLDILLDTWPYSGGTTTAYAIQFGIPVVTLKGKTLAQNQCTGILKNINITNTIANDVEEYIKIASSFASMPFKGLQKIKLKNYNHWQSIINEKQNSNNFKNLEDTLINVWEKYCEREG